MSLSLPSSLQGNVSSKEELATASLFCLRALALTPSGQPNAALDTLSGSGVALAPVEALMRVFLAEDRVARLGLALVLLGPQWVFLDPRSRWIFKCRSCVPRTLLDARSLTRDASSSTRP